MARIKYLFMEVDFKDSAYLLTGMINILKMKKCFLIIIIFLMSMSLVNSLDLCEDKPEIDTNCIMVTPELTQCTVFDYKIFNTNGTIIETGNLAPLKDDVYHFNITLPKGDYLIRLCDGALREITIKENVNNRYYLYVVALLVFFGLLILGYYLQDPVFVIIAGMLSSVIALNIFLNGFPNLTNEFLKNGISIVLAGIGFYFILAPTIEFFENFKGRIGGRLE